MKERSNAVWIAALAVTAAVAAGGTWLVVDRTDDQPMGDPVAVVAETPTDDPAADAAAPSWLFSQTAGAGTFVDDGDGSGTLTLTDVAPGVTGFTDRPDRDTVVISVETLVEAWPTLFADSAPNAVLVEHDPAGDTDSFVLELSDPAFDGTTLTFAAKVVHGEDHSSQLPGLTATPYTTPPETFSTVSLFIDNVLPSQMWICSKPGVPVMNSPAAIPYPASATATSTFEVQCLAAGGKPSIIGAA